MEIRLVDFRQGLRFGRSVLSLAVLALVLCAPPAAADRAGGASDTTGVRVHGTIAAGESVVVVGRGLRPGRHVTGFIKLGYRRSCCGVAVGGVRVVRRGGRVRVRFRWPAAYQDCSADGRRCFGRTWRKGQRVLVGLDSPAFHPRSDRDRLRKPLTAFVTVRSASSPPRSPRAPVARRASSNLTGISLDRTCDSPWMSSAGAVGSGISFAVSFVPSERARYLAKVPVAYGHVWDDLQRCVPFEGVVGYQWDSLYKQMVCHIVYGFLRFGGNTFDLEAWRPDVPWPTAMKPDIRDGKGCNWPPAAGAGEPYANHIVQWSGDTKAHKTSWHVVRSGDGLVRNWIPTSKAYGCLKAKGAPGPDILSSGYLDEVLPDAVGTHVSEAAACGTAPPASGPPAGGGSPSLLGPWPEQQGSLGANTFLNPYNASGMGVKIQPYQWVSVSCKVYAPYIASANPDGYWYRIASPPWSNAYYAVANTFWNGDIPGRKPYVHFTDFAVRDC